MPSCARCGQCCHEIERDDNAGEYFITAKKCQYLIKIGKLSSCRIYSQRLGTRINGNEKMTCVDRKKSSFNYEGCPLNREGFPTIRRRPKT
jgi:uncharacterized cysteine cluster protein YcgN (CxxCxxCC family)